uniref:Bm1361 n=1 Tax=Brugia malayi TaxID=6279 RepID=A0A1I9GEB7_BRUMA|nr:Bm1361 [Brugia malayi]
MVSDVNKAANVLTMPSTVFPFHQFMIRIFDEALKEGNTMLRDLNPTFQYILLYGKERKISSRSALSRSVVTRYNRRQYRFVFNRSSVPEVLLTHNKNLMLW